MAKSNDQIRELLQAVYDGSLDEKVAKLGAWQRRQIAGQLALKEEYELTSDEKAVLAALRAVGHNKPSRGNPLAVKIFGPDGTEEKSLDGTTSQLAEKLGLENSWKLASKLLKEAKSGKLVVIGVSEQAIDRLIYGADEAEEKAEKKAEEKAEEIEEEVKI